LWFGFRLKSILGNDLVIPKIVVHNKISPKCHKYISTLTKVHSKSFIHKRGYGEVNPSI